MANESRAGASAELDAFALGVRHQEMETALEGGRVSDARQTMSLILELTGRAVGAQAIKEAYRRLDSAIQAGPTRSSPLLLAATLRRSMAHAGFSSGRFELGLWASGCRLAAARRDLAYFSGREAHRGWVLVRSDALPKPALDSLDSARCLLDEGPATDPQWRRLEEAFRQFILLL